MMFHHLLVTIMVYVSTLMMFAISLAIYDTFFLVRIIEQEATVTCCPQLPLTSIYGKYSCLQSLCLRNIKSTFCLKLLPGTMKLFFVPL